MSESLDLYLDANKFGGTDCLLTLKTTTPRSEEIHLIAGDKVPVDLYFRQLPTDGSTTTTAFSLGTDTVGFDSDKIPAASMSSFSSTGSGDDVHYSATLDLTSLSQDLIDELAENDEAAVVLDFQTQDAGPGRKLTYRVKARIHAQSSSTSGVAAGITISQPGGPGTPFVISGNGRAITL